MASMRASIRLGRDCAGVEPLSVEADPVGRFYLWRQRGIPADASRARIWAINSGLIHTASFVLDDIAPF